MSSRAYQKTASKAVALVVVMGSLAWASVPFYDWFCRTTGFGGVPSIVEADSEAILERTMKVRFDASLERGMPWEFTPVEREMERFKVCEKETKTNVPPYFCAYELVLASS